MREIDLNSWADFKGAIDKIVGEYGRKDFPESTRRNRILYRGHGNSQWPLESTLERFCQRTWSIEEYAHLALRCAPQIEFFTEVKWNLPTYPELEKQLREESLMFFANIPCYDFWVYLRHHGFPSPLLDWTRSPYIAAFFAFAETTENDTEKDRGRTSKHKWASLAGVTN